MAKITKDEAFAAAFELKAVIIDKQARLDANRRTYPADRLPADVKGNNEKWETTIALLTPVLAFLEEKAGRAAPSL